ncbi:hypothetical protein PHSY_000496 [Pseudozyma hubeiensis SY62]|uniref:Uncharacterized protein n=1 Tax=Pseudozyma hubeiensis (strain SY62) TaxID=1305764 RepID=R9NWS5_PSEHS|nr:hypothetical protein PHSY_000496 [Pseudozyma hubeiensis SY62]GAC92937.1 hypothetical protein PHSY_000496 [Pseudozyma hubeiensis SY62]
MMYDRERDRARSDREREWEWEREREREHWERERERDRARAGPPYAGGPSSRNPPPPNHPNDRRSPNMPYGHVSTSPSSQSAPPRRKWSGSDDAASAYHKEREWEREREYELEREREMRWRASQRSGGGPDMQPSQHGRALSGDMRYAVGGPVSGMPGELNQSPREPYASSLPPRRSPAPGLSNRAGVAGARVREQSADVPLAAMGPESSPRHAPYPGGPYDDPRSGSMPPGHAGGMLPPAGRSPERMRAPLSHGPYDGHMSERELMQRERDREREREMMAGDRYGRRMHGESMVMDDPYDRYGPRGPPSGALGPPSSKSASGRPYDERGPPPPLPYPPASPTQSRDGDRRKDKVKQAPTREPSAPAQSRPGGPGGSGPLPSHFEADRHPRSGPPPPMGSSRESSVKLESGPRRAPLSPTSERGALFRDGPQHRGPSIPPYGGPASDRDIRERDRELALQREREYEAEHERQRLRLREREQREREIELEREREREMDRERERERLRIEELERERQKERERELEREQEREREKEREKEKERERRERRREKQHAEKMAAMEREKEREFQAQAQAQAQAHAAAAAAAAAGMHPGAIGELPSHMRPPPASLEEALIATAQQQAAAYGRPPNMADFHAAAAAIGYPPGMPLPPAIHPAMFGGGMGPGSEAMVPHQPHVIRDPNAGPRVDSEPVWLYLELCERDESIRRAERLPLDMLAEEQKKEIAAELAGVAPAIAAEQAPPASEDAGEANASAVATVSTSQTVSVAAKQADAAALPTTAADKDTTVSVTEIPIDPLPRHLIGMDKGRPVRHLGSWIYDPTVDPLFPAELLARNVGSTLEVRIPGDLLSCGSRGGPHWEQYRSLETECLARCQVGDPLKDLLEGERGRVALNGASNNWKLGWRGKEHARMSLEMRIEERIAEAQLFGHKLPGISQESSAREEVNRSEEKKQPDGVAAAVETKSEADTKEGETAGEVTVAPTENGMALKTSASSEAVSPWRFWRLNPLFRRKLWGTDVYTDDSDVLAMCVHAGWVEGPSLEAEGIPAWVPPGRAARAWNGLTLAGSTSGTAAGSTADVQMSDAASLDKQSASVAVRPDISCDLSVILRIAPKLIAYKGCQRGGIKSRSWGNSHDGVSLVVESVELKQPGYAQSKGRKSAKARIDQLAFYRNAMDNSSAAKPSSSSSGSPSPVNAELTADNGHLDLKTIMQDTQLIPLSSVVGELKKSSPAVDKEQAEAAKQQRLFWEIQ